MRKRTELVITLILALLFSLVAGVPAIKKAKANPYGMTLMMWRDKIVVQSPQNKTCNVETLPINFTVEYMEANKLRTGYILNNQKPVYVTPTAVSTKIMTGHIYKPSTSQNTTYKITAYIAQYNFLLPNLADGTYNLTVVRTRASASVIFTIDTIPPNVSVLSVENKTYGTSGVPLNFTVSEKIAWISYSLDGQTNVSITGNTTLTGLPEGPNSLVIFTEDTAGNTGASEPFYFIVDTTLPTISILETENKTYEATDIPLNFAVTETVSQITYSLDGQANVTITGNTTLTGLPEGSHNLTVYAKDSAGNIGTSETIYFSIDQKPKLEILGSSLPIEYDYALVIASVAVVTIAGYLFIKRFHRPKQNSTVILEGS